MTMSVWKYPIPMRDEFGLLMPRGAEILTVREQNGQGCLWARVDTTEITDWSRRFLLRGTGYINADGKYVGSFHLQDGAFVFHLFEVTQ